jgi:hypothetical protein
MSELSLAAKEARPVGAGRWPIGLCIVRGSAGGFVAPLAAFVVICGRDVIIAIILQ